MTLSLALTIGFCLLFLAQLVFILAACLANRKPIYPEEPVNAYQKWVQSYEVNETATGRARPDSSTYKAKAGAPDTEGRASVATQFPHTASNNTDNLVDTPGLHVKNQATGAERESVRAMDSPQQGVVTNSGGSPLMSNRSGLCVETFHSIRRRILSKILTASPRLAAGSVQSSPNEEPGRDISAHPTASSAIARDYRRVSNAESAGNRLGLLLSIGRTVKRV